MSYTPPAGSTANFSWVGASAYTAPSGSAANLVWPLVLDPIFVEAAAASPLGSPAAFALVHTVVSASGFKTTALGAPAGRLRLSTSGIYSTNHGTPSTPVPQTCVVSGFGAQKIGVPTRYVPPVAGAHQYAAALPVVSGSYGTPSCATSVVVEAQGYAVGQFGAPVSLARMGAQSIGPTLYFGAPSLMLSQRAAGLAGTVFGTPVAARAQRAAGTYTPTKWGTPTCERSNTYLARSIVGSARFGRAAAYKINAYQAGYVSGPGNFGGPACVQRYRAMSLHASVRFGKPLLSRSSAC